MVRFRLGSAGLAAFALSVSLVAGPAGLSTGEADATGHRASGVGSCTLKNWNPSADAGDAKDLPQGARPQSYKPDDYDCTGATFAQPGVEFTKFPQPHNKQTSFVIDDTALNVS